MFVGEDLINTLRIDGTLKDPDPDCSLCKGKGKLPMFKDITFISSTIELPCPCTGEIEPLARKTALDLLHELLRMEQSKRRVVEIMEKLERFNNESRTDRGQTYSGTGQPIH